MNISEKIKKEMSLNNDVPTRRGNSNLSISIINSENNGKRIVFSKYLLTKLGNPSALQFVIFPEENSLFIGSNLLPDENKYAFTKEDSNILYCGKVINQIVETFNLDYSNGKTSITFSNIEIEEENGNVIATVKFN